MDQVSSDGVWLQPCLCNNFGCALNIVLPRRSKILVFSAIAFPLSEITNKDMSTNKENTNKTEKRSYVLANVFILRQFRELIKHHSEMQSEMRKCLLYSII